MKDITINKTFPIKRSKKIRRTAVTLSYILHPIFFPTVMVAVICFLNVSGFAGITTPTKWKWIGITAFQTLFFPLVTVFLMWRLGFVKSMYLKTKKERIGPLIAIMVFYFWVYYVFKRSLGAPFILNTFFLGAFWGIITLYICNIFIKVSMHTTAAGGVIGIMILLLFTSQVNVIVPFLLAMIVAGIVGSARLILRAHHHNEIWLGYLIGFVSQLAAFWFLS